MKIGALFPQTDLTPDPTELRRYACTLVELGYSHLIAYEHVLGAVPERLPVGYAPYGLEDPFMEPFVLFAFLAAAAPQLGMATGVLVLPQRQTPLVAKQAATLDHMLGGKLRLGIGIGWNFAEFEGLGKEFKNRARRMEEQIDLLRALWTQDVVHFQGTYEQVAGCAIRPLPIQRPIPLWVGGSAEPALRRAAEKADGFFPQRPLEGGWESTLQRMREWREAAGKSWEGYGMEARVTLNPGWEGEVEAWRTTGATHLSLSALGLGLKGASEHLRVMEQASRKLGLNTVES